MMSPKLGTTPLLLLGLVASQSPAQIKAPPAGKGDYDAYYGEPENTDLQEIQLHPDLYAHRTVRVKGVLFPESGTYFMLQEAGVGSAKVLAIPVDELSSDMRSVAGRELELVGLVRQIPDHQEIVRCPTPVPESKCTDPLLPALPNRQQSWPFQSLTFWRGTDLADPRHRAGRAPGAVDLESLVSEPGAHDGQKVTVTGQFRGNNLFGDLPAKSERSASDWVLKDGAYAVWVVGKSPKGSGFELDPKLESDTRRWLEVVGKPETIDGVVYLRAQKVSLSAAPKNEE